MFLDSQKLFYRRTKIVTQLFTSIFTALSENVQLLRMQAHGTCLPPSRAEPIRWGLARTPRNARRSPTPRGLTGRGLVSALLRPGMV